MIKYNENSDISKNAYKLSCKKFTKEEIFEILKNGEDFQKPIAILNLIEANQKEIEELIFYLTNQGSPVREAVSMMFAMFNPEITKNMEDKIILALCDVNPNVCRNIVEFLKNTNGFILREKILEKIEQILGEIDKECSKFRKNKEKNHVLNKKIFHLYWCLEGLCYTTSETDEKMTEILERCTKFYDYTIREKTAQILNKIKNPPLELVEKLKNDENFYVRNKF